MRQNYEGENMETEKKEDEFEKFAQDVKQLAYVLKAGLCPIWQCGGILEHIERINWQEPDLKCKSCGAEWKLINRPKGEE